VYERDALVSERARQLLAAEGLAVCAVDDPGLFDELRQRCAFDLYVLGVCGPEELCWFPGTGALSPLLVLAPLSDESAGAHYRVALPGAVLVDRALRDPDALRGVAGAPPPRDRSGPAPDTVREAFLPFGLSERQLEVLSSALVGETSRQIAKKLFISELTVRNHLHAIYERVGVSGRRELLGRFVQGLIEGHA
jgi:DNA-binding CsgD family transcriptional regulator